jgi:sulfate transport system ATP-binding protein
VAGSIEVSGLTKSFGAFRAVDDISFTAAEGGITALLGPSGSGKSTVLRMIAGLEQPDAGRIYVSGEELTNASVQDRRLGFVFQHYALFRHMTVRRNVAFGLSVRRESKTRQRERVDELLELVGLRPLAERYPDQLSGGQRQRVALARALAPRPSVLLLDEPFGALDARVRQELRRWLDELHQELGVTSLFVTHDQEEALELANEVVVMNHGRIEQTGTADEIYNRPAGEFVAAFVGTSNAVRGVAEGGQVRVGDATLPVKTDVQDGAQVLVYVRTHDIDLCSEPTDASLAVTVERRTDLGGFAKIHLQLDNGQTLIAHLRNEEAAGVDVGARLHATVRNPKVFAEGEPGPAAVVPDESDTDPRLVRD